MPSGSCFARRVKFTGRVNFAFENKARSTVHGVVFELFSSAVAVKKT